MTSTEKFLLITGGTRGIGRAVTLAQADRGTHLFVNFLRDEDSAEKLKAEAEKKGARVTLVQGNVADSETLEGIYGQVRKATDRLDALVHSAALGVFKPLHELREKDWDISLDVNAKAFLRLAQGALPLMKNHGGRIVTISSLGARRFTPDNGAIGVSKAALENIVRYLAVELSPYKIRVNAVSGGLVETDSLKMFPRFEALKKDYLARTPAGRIGKPEDIARVVSFLLSPDADWIAGQTLVADGGYSLS
jgi:enoyl-[acyl-carrier protein] reductase III